MPPKHVTPYKLRRDERRVLEMLDAHGVSESCDITRLQDLMSCAVRPYLDRLERRGLVRCDSTARRWRITDEGAITIHALRFVPPTRDPLRVKGALDKPKRDPADALIDAPPPYYGERNAAALRDKKWA